MKKLRVTFCIYKSEVVEIETDDDIDEAIETAAEIIAEGYDYNMDDWTYVDAHIIEE